MQSYVRTELGALRDLHRVIDSIEEPHVTVRVHGVTGAVGQSHRVCETGAGSDFLWGVSTVEVPDGTAVIRSKARPVGQLHIRVVECGA